MVAHDERRLASADRRLVIALVIVSVMLVAEVIGGILSNSLALLSDAGHMLVDALALGMSLVAMRIARRPPTSTRTFGYHRVEIMAALTNGVVLFVTAGAIFYQAYQRFSDPPPVEVGLMVGVAIIGLIANLVGIKLLRTASRGSLNIRAALWHIIGDTISSVGVIAAGAIIYFTGWLVVDSIIAMVIGGIILWGAVRLVRDSSDILLEAVPRHIEIERVIETIKKVPGVENVHDIHVWTITSGIYALSAHLLIQDQMVSRSAEIVRMVNDNVATAFNIGHTTLQIECQTCATACICDIAQIQHPEG